MLPTSAGVEHATSWSPVGRHIQLSHRGRRTRWCKREHVESNALNNWKLKIFKIIDERVLFYSNNLDLPSKPKLSFRCLKQGIQEFHRKYVLAPADKAANNVVVV